MSVITYFARGICWKDGKQLKVKYLDKAHTSIIHRGQRFYIKYLDDGIRVIHGPSGSAISNDHFKFKRHDRPEDIEWRIRKALDANWSNFLEKVGKVRGYSWKH